MEFISYEEQIAEVYGLTPAEAEQYEQDERDDAVLNEAFNGE